MHIYLSFQTNGLLRLPKALNILVINKIFTYSLEIKTAISYKSTKKHQFPKFNHALLFLL